MNMVDYLDKLDKMDWRFLSKLLLMIIKPCFTFPSFHFVMGHHTKSHFTTSLAENFSYTDQKPMVRCADESQG